MGQPGAYFVQGIQERCFGWFDREILRVTRTNSSSMVSKVSELIEYIAPPAKAKTR